MPAPQAVMMKQFARLKFASFGLKVPTNWKDPQGDPAAAHYGKAFKAQEKATVMDMGSPPPPLFMPATLNKYHTDTQKKHNSDVGGFIDKICTAICSAWGQWQMAAVMTGVQIAGPVATGGQIVGPMLQAFIMPQAPVNTAQLAKYSNVVASVISNAWMQYTATIKIPGMPLYPAFAAFPGPIAPPMPNLPAPLIALTQVDVGLQPNALKSLMVAQLGDPTAPFHGELFEAIATAFNQCFTIWKASTIFNNILGTGPIPTFAPPYVPVGPVVGGQGNMIPTGIT